MNRTMTTWGAHTKLEALAVAADRLHLPGRIEIREHVERLLSRSDMGKATMTAELIEWRGLVGIYHDRTARWLDAALFDLITYLGLPEVQLSGAELLDQLLDGAAAAELEQDVNAASFTYQLSTLR